MTNSKGSRVDNLRSTNEGISYTGSQIEERFGSRPDVNQDIFDMVYDRREAFSEDGEVLDCFEAMNKFEKDFYKNPEEF